MLSPKGILNNIPHNQIIRKLKMSSVPSQQISFRQRKGADTRLRELSANEVVFAVVGPVGSGTSWVAKALAALVGNATYSMEVHIIKASEVITQWHIANVGPILETESAYAKVTALQNAGDLMRKDDPAAVAVELVSAIKAKRDSIKNNVENVSSITPIQSKKRRVYILDSLKHPAEVELLRAIYQDAFCLIGVVCDEESRKERLQNQKCTSSGVIEIKSLMKRDEDDSEAKHGQKVTDTFHLADFFVDNSPPRFLDKDKLKPNPAWEVTDQLGRLVDLITVGKLIRPTPSETGMFHAYGAKMRSSCMSRQVGAALLDKRGNIVATGTNEVPRSGGGVYGGSFDNFDETLEVEDDRCHISKRFCSSNKEQNEIIGEIINAIPALREVTDRVSLAQQLKKTPIGKLLEFSRAVHAEMDALLSAARTGSTTVGTRLFVTTYPCHYCARHIVSAGVDEVQYIEPYPKSRALKLHGDAISNLPSKWIAPSAKHSKAEAIEIRKEGKEKKVLFRPFTGVAPRLYRKVFLKDRPFKDGNGDFMIGEAEWASGLFKLSYEDLEKNILDKGEAL
jgi:deoxycytidylate deaminase